MNKKLIDLIDIGFYNTKDKICFERFSASIYSGKRIVIMGPNGAGKSTLLKIIQGQILPSTGAVNIWPGVSFGYVPQTINDYQSLSGGQRFNKSLSQALSTDPEILCLDEPTNHLDKKNKKSLIRMLENYQGALIIVSHDPEVLNLYFDEIWDIENGKVEVFAGNYQEYLQERQDKLNALEKERESLLKEKRVLSKKVEQEHKRRASSKAANKHESDKLLLNLMKETGQKTEGKKLGWLRQKKDEVAQKLSEVIIAEKIKPRFNLDAQKLSSSKVIVSVIDGSCGYASGDKGAENFEPVLHDINLQVGATERIAILGDNGSGKSTFMKALLRNLQDSSVIISGQWVVPKAGSIGYLDQHYSTVDQKLTVMEVIQSAAPDMDDLQVRKYLNDFLFRKTVEVENKVENLSGGEKVRSCLAQMAVKNPYLLLLDEITNNIDIQAREYILQVLDEYRGAIIIVSHDEEFLQELKISTFYEIREGLLNLVF